MAFVALGQVHRRVRAAGRRSGDLHERVPALLVLPGQQARVDPAAAGEGEVGRGHDRPVLHRPDQEDEGDVRPSTCPSPHWARRFNPCSTTTRPMRSTSTAPGARRSQRAGGGLTLVKGNFFHDRSRGAGEGGRGLLRPRVRATAPVQPRSKIDGGHGSRVSESGPSTRGEGTGVVGETLDLELFRTSSGRRGSGRPDTSTRSTPEACPSRTRTPPLLRIVPWLFLR